MNFNEHNIQRGEIYQVSLGKTADGQELNRPVLVIQNDVGNRLYDSTIVVPLSPKVQAKRLFVSVIAPADHTTGLKEEHVALFFQIRTLSKEKFNYENYLGKVDNSTIWKVDEAIKLSLGLSTLQWIDNRKKA
ncbi:mRNA interferase MazF [Desulfitispora alkaliphila]|uniref:type II toxin-antitoxin system PemK/MazF family toxin n=1 Tax=Desulfitispora alkaliphila TaxID=622674 RepID=UPI003D24E5DA